MRTRLYDPLHPALVMRESYIEQVVDQRY